jgi:TIR domain
MSYDYDVFVSYRRAGNARKWVKNHFVPTLEDCLAYELISPPRVFADSQLESGTTWPPDLGQKLGASRMLISLWSKEYLNSKWCSMELAHMLAREKELGFRTAEKPGGLIAIAVIHGDEELPKPLGAIQTFQIRDYFNTRMRVDSELAEQLEKALRAEAPTLAKIISLAPEFQVNWSANAAQEFYDAFNQPNPPSQDRGPTFTGP